MSFASVLIRLCVVLSVLLSSACASVQKKEALAATLEEEASLERTQRLQTSEPARVAKNDATPLGSVSIIDSAPKPPTPLECASRLPLKNRVGQLMFPLVSPADFTQAQQLASVGLLGGVVVLGSPTASIRSAIADYQKRSLYGPGIIAVDEEGGRVQRLANLTSRMPSARKVARTMTLLQARRLASDHANAIGNLGFTMNLAPVADVDFGRAIGDRSFSSDAYSVSDYAIATADGIIDAGLVPVLKHFPGHGRGSDSHYGLPVIPPVDVLRKDDLLPFINVAHRKDVPIMVGHLVVEDLTHGQPASLSKEAISGLLRDEMGFDGLVMTDAFNMDAISDSLTDAQATELSLAAGADLIMLSSISDTQPAVNRVMQAVNAGRISERSINESFLRVMHTRAIDACGFAAYQ